MNVKKTTVREDVEWTITYRFESNSSEYERILLIGDSIVNGHGAYLQQELKGNFNVDYYATSLCVSDEKYMDEVNMALSWDKHKLIMFNNGLHGWNVSDECYADNLLLVLEELKDRGYEVVWRNTTPCREKENLNEFHKEYTPRIKRRNADALNICKKLGVPVFDLYTPMFHGLKYYSPDGTHYNEEGKRCQAKLIAEFILRSC